MATAGWCSSGCCWLHECRQLSHGSIVDVWGVAMHLKHATCRLSHAATRAALPCQPGPWRPRLPHTQPPSPVCAWHWYSTGCVEQHDGHCLRYNIFDHPAAMAPDAGALQSRVAQLEDELATVVAQVRWPSTCLAVAQCCPLPVWILCCTTPNTVLNSAAQAEAAAIGAEQASQVGGFAGLGHCARCPLHCMSPEVHQRVCWQLQEQRTTRPPLPPPRRHCPPLPAGE